MKAAVVQTRPIFNDRKGNIERALERMDSVYVETSHSPTEDSQPQPTTCDSLHTKVNPDSTATIFIDKP